MPIYEHRCGACRHRFERLASLAERDEMPVCPRCGEPAPRLVSRFRRGRNDEERLDAMADRLDDMDEVGSSTEMRKMVREMGRSGEDDASDELEEMFESDMEESAP